MRWKAKGVGVAVSILLALALGLPIGVGYLAAAELTVGRPFPELMLPSMDGGQPTSIADFRGRKLILHIWASW